LKKAGASDATIKNLLHKATELLDDIRQPTPKKKELLSHITTLRDEVCSIATALPKKGQKTENKKELKENLLRCGYTAGGAAMILANASAWAASIGLSTPGSAVSGAAGTALIAYGLTPK
jgi:hypothetical protein